MPAYPAFNRSTASSSVASSRCDSSYSTSLPPKKSVAKVRRSTPGTGPTFSRHSRPSSREDSVRAGSALSCACTVAMWLPKVD